MVIMIINLLLFKIIILFDNKNDDYLIIKSKVIK